jgi:hypothetical protein
MEKATMDLATELKRQFADRDDLYADIDAVLFGELPVDIPEAYRKTAIEVRSPLALHIATTVTAALSVNPMTVRFKPIGFGDIYQANSTLREQFFEASWNRQEQEARRQLLRLFLWSLAVKGEGIIKTCERSRTAWATYDQQSKDLQAKIEKNGYDQDAADRVYHAQTEDYKLQAPYPIASTDVPPETFYYAKNENGLTAVVEIKDVPYLEALERFGAGLDSNGDVTGPSNGLGGYDPRATELARAEWSHLMRGANCNTLRCIEAWDSQCQVILLQGPNQRYKGGSLGQATLCKVVRHSYGDPLLGTLKGPYFHALGITTASRLPEHAGLSILFGFLRLFPLLDSLLTMQGNAAYMTGFPAFKKTVPPGTIPGIGQPPPYGQDGRERSNERIEPGKLYPYDVSPIDQPKSGIDADKLVGNIKSMLEWALPSVVQGLVGGDQSGYALNQAAYLARLGWDPIVSNAETALGERIGFESWLVEHRIGEKVYAWGEQEARRGNKKVTAGQSKATWLGIGPEDLKGIHRYEAKLSPSTPSNEIIQTRAIGEKMQLRLITYEDAVEEAGSNPDEVEKSWLLHDLKSSPEIQAELKNTIFQKMATIRAAKLQAPGMPTPEEMAGGPMPPGPLPPGLTAGATGLPGGTPGTPPIGLVGGMPPNPVPSPGMGLPLAPPPPPGAAGGAMPPGGIPGGPVVPGPPPANIPLPGGMP